MIRSRKDAVVGGLYLMWAGNPDMQLGELISNFLAVEGEDLEDVPDEIWPQRQWAFCPWCGKPDPRACQDRENPDSCVSKLWDDA